MADFNVALDALLAEEGGYSNNSADAGGETVFGISRVYNPNWLGWPFVDALKKEHSNLVDLNTALENDAQVRTAVQNFYRQAYWNYDKLKSQVVGNKLLEIEVNFGKGSGIRLLQQALIKIGFALDLDGSLGPRTLDALENAKEPDVLHGLRAFSALYRLHRILTKPDQVVFAEGWLWRDTA